eukprot:2694269-Ditylum_brightwellii.AAC.1
MWGPGSGAGTQQGSTNSPTIWLIISSTLFGIHEELCNGATFSNTVQEIEVNITLVGFVDDVTGQTNDFYNKGVYWNQISAPTTLYGISFFRMGHQSSSQQDQTHH